MERVAPPVVGVVRREDGSAAAGVRVSSAADATASACARGGPLVTTDAAGRFALPEQRVKKRILWLTLMENFGLVWYGLCAQPAAAAAPLAAPLTGFFRGDSVDCLLWRWGGAERLSCDNTRRARTVVTGGAWTDGAVGGEYRVIVYGWRAYVQWVELAADGTPARVRTTMELPTEGRLWGDTAPAFTHPNAWRVVLGDRWTFELGAPGVVARLPGA
jgi:hypothetical protein